MRISRARIAVIVAFTAHTPLAAQDLGKRVVASDGTINVVYPSRQTVCGDGRSFIQNVLGESRYYTNDGDWRDDRRIDACIHGPARALVTVLDGAVTRLRLSVGPVPNTPADAGTITTSAAEAVQWLTDLATHGTSRVASDAILPIVVADAPDPWPLLLRIARDDDRPRDVRRSTLLWLSSAVSDHLGISGADSHATADDEMRDQAVFVLSQRPKSESVPELIDLAKNSKHPAARKAAIFWLSQSGDLRAADVYAELLGLR